MQFLTRSWTLFLDHVVTLWAAEVKRALNISVQARVGNGDVRAEAINEGKLILKSLAEVERG